MKRSAIVGVIIFLLFIVDNSVVPFITIKGICPSLLFVFIISYSIINDPWEGLFVGLFSGILQDVYFIRAFGVNSLLNMLLCILASIIGINIIKKKILIPIFTCFLLSILKGILLILISYIIKVNINYLVIFLSSIYNAIVFGITYKIVYNFCTTNKYMQKKWKF